MKKSEWDVEHGGDGSKVSFELAVDAAVELLETEND